jgi:hypothetical protein
MLENEIQTPSNLRTIRPAPGATAAAHESHPGQSANGNVAAVSAATEGPVVMLVRCEEFQTTLDRSIRFRRH